MRDPACKKKATHGDGAMRISRLLSQPTEAPEEERPSRSRELLWIAMAVLLIVGIVLYFRYARLLTPMV